MYIEERQCENTVRRQLSPGRRKKASEKTKPASTLILDFQSPELGENKCLLFKSSSLWYFVTQPELSNTDTALCLMRCEGQSHIVASPDGQQSICSPTCGHGGEQLLGFTFMYHTEKDVVSEPAQVWQ